jgi:3D (Asp-Asp-Asp) domain-containing protein
MLKNRIVCILSMTLLFTFPTESNISPFQTTQVVVKDNEGMVHKDRFGLLINPIQEQFKKDKLEFEKKKAEELKIQKEKEIQKQKKNEPQWQEFILTYYSGLQCENSPKGAITCTGKKLQPYMIANNTYSLGTQIYLEGYGTKVVADRGSNKYFNNDIRLDVYIERDINESDSHYFNRVNKMGVKKIRGYIVK